MDRYRKFWAAVVGGAATAALGIFAPNTVWWKAAMVVAAAATAATVYQVPNEPNEPNEPTPTDDPTTFGGNPS